MTANVPQMLDGKTAVVTGANRGIGKCIAETFAAHGAHVIACARHVDAAVTNWASSTAGEITPVTLDLADPNAIKATTKDIRSASPSIDILVNNAGMAIGGLFQMTSITDMRAVFEVNFFGQINLTQAVARLMARQKAGSIINITSTAAEIADAGTLTYGASKAAFARATKSMATELGAQGIRVNAIAPGVTQTDMYDGMDSQARDRLIQSSALQRAATPQDIANTALFLASDLSTHITGQIIRVDGGIV